ncbi:TlpA family protein disulfide reductase [Paenibacillus agilis]|uniref:Thioredoxin domain-containing protein n=1 Tax=Paenibacillus agilis TaxID=3020863 RepID=A0A559J3D4_9BACL|nr:hypothetical protein [Paenibacillus agilis]TVX94383.1 hypothetical protein FPZ44_15770 [Paenibacillus agilis]
MNIMQWAQLVMFVMLIVVTISLTQVYQRSIKRELYNTDKGFSKGEDFPLLSLPSMSGEMISLVRPSTEGTIVTFTSTSCAYCASLYPTLTPFQEKQPQLKVVSLMVGDMETITEKVNEFKIKTPISQIEDEDLPNFNVNVLPFAYFLNKEGKVVAKGSVSSEDDLKILLQMARSA